MNFCVRPKKASRPHTVALAHIDCTNGTSAQLFAAQSYPHMSCDFLNVVRSESDSTASVRPDVAVARHSFLDERQRLLAARLKATDRRITKPRLRIIRALLEAPGPQTIEQLHLSLPDGTADLVTVYRCLEAFEEARIVRRLFRHNGTALFEALTDSTYPVYITSKETGRLRTIDDDLAALVRPQIQEIERTLAVRGFKDVSSVVTFYGVFV